MLVSSNSSLFEVWADVMNDTIDFRFYWKGKNSYDFIESIRWSSQFDFEERYLLLNYKLNHLLNKGYLPI
jgi:hypothetical protein